MRVETIGDATLRMSDTDLIRRLSTERDKLREALTEIVDRHDVLDHCQLVAIARAALTTEPTP